jgi:predicted nucleic acid-binding protein
LPLPAESRLLGIYLLDTPSGFWQRAGKLRASLFKKGHRPKLADTLIAQSCIDHNVALITRDRDFGPFARYGALKLITRRPGEGHLTFGG